MAELYALSFLAAYIGVALKAFQQLSVMHDRMLWVPPVSYGMALSEVLIIHAVAEYGIGWIIFWIGTGGWMGALSSMWLHRRLRHAPRTRSE